MENDSSLFRSIVLVAVFSSTAGVSALSAQAAPVGLPEDQKRSVSETSTEGLLAFSAPRMSVLYYLDDREFDTLEVLVSGELPYGFSYWGFSDFHGSQGQSDGRFDFARSFSEYRLSHPGLGNRLGISGLGIQAEYNALDPGSEIVRLGVTYRHELPKISNESAGGLVWRVFPLQSSGEGGQLSLIYSLPLYRNVALSGFADLNLVPASRDRWVTESQLSIRVSPRIRALVEYRFSGFERASPDLEGSGWAIGIGVDL